MPHKIVVSRAQPREAIFHAKSLVRLDMGSPEHLAPSLEKYRRQSDWEQALQGNEQRVHVANISPPYQAVGYCVLHSPSFDSWLDIEPSFHVPERRGELIIEGQVIDEQIVLNAMYAKAEALRVNAALIQVQSRQSSVSV